MWWTTKSDTFTLLKGCVGCWYFPPAKTYLSDFSADAFNHSFTPLLPLSLSLLFSGRAKVLPIALPVAMPKRYPKIAQICPRHPMTQSCLLWCRAKTEMCPTDIHSCTLKESSVELKVNKLTSARAWEHIVPLDFGHEAWVTWRVGSM